jgi:predicted GNAT superfamily acetyltransferase
MPEALDSRSDQDIRIRSLTGLADFDRCVALQDEVWGYEPEDRMTQKVFLLASRIGGQVLGAFHGDVQVGYAMSLPGVREGRPYLHSHHLAVVAAYRNGGVGRSLKLAQREEALSRSITLMEWTFDPLEIRNAHLNIARLGAIVRRYSDNFYGESSSPLQGGLPTDRLYAEWWLRSEHVDRALAGDQRVLEPVRERVIVPAEIYAWKASDDLRNKARAVQQANAEALKAAFTRGLAVIGYERTAAGDGVFLLGEWHSAGQWHKEKR